MNLEIIFSLPPRNLELRNGEAHVFCAALDVPRTQQERFEKILSADERARAMRFVFARDRDRFVAGRGTLREILGWLLHTDPARLAFAYGEYGKPRLATPAGRPLHFNLAHSDALALYIVSARDAVGIDVERIREFREAEIIAAQFFSAHENTEWHSLPAAQQTGAFFEYWTRKEALLKAVGSSLGIEPPPPSRRAAPQSNAAETTLDFSGFFVHFLTAAPGYQAAAATRGIHAPCCWHWPAW